MKDKITAEGKMRLLLLLFQAGRLVIEGENTLSSRRWISRRWISRRYLEEMDLKEVDLAGDPKGDPEEDLKGVLKGDRQLDSRKGKVKARRVLALSAAKLVTSSGSAPDSRSTTDRRTSPLPLQPMWWKLLMKRRIC